MRHRESRPPQDVRELEAIDRTLAGEPVEPALSELEQLVGDVRASAPQMSAALSARLERIVEHGPATDVEAEAPPRRFKRWPPRRFKHWLLLPAVATTAAAVVAIVVGLGGGPGETLRSSTALQSAKSSPAAGTTSAPTPSGPASAADEAAPSSRSARRADSAAAPAPSAAAGTVVAPERRRKVEQSVFMTLSTGKDELASTADEIDRTVARFRGIVASSSVSTNDTSGGEATFDLRIPTSRLQAALAALARLGHVVERRQDLQDITASFTSTRDRLQEARAERRGLLTALAKATTRNQIESLRARLRLVGAQIAAAKRRLASLQRRASYARVSVSLRGDGKARGGASGGTWSPGDAAHDAVRVLEVMAGIALIALAAALPLALLGLAIVCGARLARARRREDALDGA